MPSDDIDDGSIRLKSRRLSWKWLFIPCLLSYLCYYSHNCYIFVLLQDGWNWLQDAFHYVIPIPTITKYPRKTSCCPRCPRRYRYIPTPSWVYNQWEWGLARDALWRKVPCEHAASPWYAPSCTICPVLIPFCSSSIAKVRWTVDQIWGWSEHGALQYPCCAHEEGQRQCFVLV